MPQLDPEHHQPCMRVSTTHVVDQFDFLRLVLPGMAVRTVRTILQRLQRPVIAFHPAVDILPVCPVPDRCRCDAILLRIVN